MVLDGYLVTPLGRVVVASESNDHDYWTEGERVEDESWVILFD